MALAGNIDSDDWYAKRGWKGPKDADKAIRRIIAHTKSDYDKDSKGKRTIPRKDSARLILVKLHYARKDCMDLIESKGFPHHSYLEENTLPFIEKKLEEFNTYAKQNYPDIYPQLVKDHEKYLGEGDYSLSLIQKNLKSVRTKKRAAKKAIDSLNGTQPKGKRKRTEEEKQKARENAEKVERVLDKLEEDKRSEEKEADKQAAEEETARKIAEKTREASEKIDQARNETERAKEEARKARQEAQAAREEARKARQEAGRHPITAVEKRTDEGSSSDEEARKARSAADEARKKAAEAMRLASEDKAGEAKKAAEEAKKAAEEAKKAAEEAARHSTGDATQRAVEEAQKAAEEARIAAEEARKSVDEVVKMTEKVTKKTTEKTIEKPTETGDEAEKKKPVTVFKLKTPEHEHEHVDETMEEEKPTKKGDAKTGKKKKYKMKKCDSCLKPIGFGEKFKVCPSCGGAFHVTCVDHKGDGTNRKWVCPECGASHLYIKRGRNYGRWLTMTMFAILIGIIVFYLLTANISVPVPVVNITEPEPDPSCVVDSDCKNYEVCRDEFCVLNTGLIEASDVENEIATVLSPIHEQGLRRRCGQEFTVDAGECFDRVDVMIHLAGGSPVGNVLLRIETNYNLVAQNALVHPDAIGSTPAPTSTDERNMETILLNKRLCEGEELEAGSSYKLVLKSDDPSSDNNQGWGCTVLTQGYRGNDYKYSWWGDYTGTYIGIDCLTKWCPAVGTDIGFKLWDITIIPD